MCKKKEKPIEKATIAEVVAECEKHIGCKDCIYYSRKNEHGCAFYYLPNQWELNKKIAQTTIVKQKVKGNGNNVTAYVAKEENEND